MNDTTALVVSIDGTVVIILPSGPVAEGAAPVTFRPVTSVVGVGKPSGPIDVDTEVIIGKIGVGKPS